MPFVWDVYTFANEETIQKMLAEMEWVEEGTCGLLCGRLFYLTCDILTTPMSIKTIPLNVDEWSIGECLDATEFVWAVGLQDSDRKKNELLAILSVLQKHSPTCKGWAQVVRSSLRHKLPRSVLKRVTNIYADKDDVFSALRLVSTRQELTKEEVRKVKKYFTPLLTQDLESTHIYRTVERATSVILTRQTLK